MKREMFSDVMDEILEEKLDTLARMVSHQLVDALIMIEGLNVKTLRRGMTRKYKGFVLAYCELEDRLKEEITKIEEDKNLRRIK